MVDLFMKNTSLKAEMVLVAKDLPSTILPRLIQKQISVLLTISLKAYGGAGKGTEKGNQRNQ